MSATRDEAALRLFEQLADLEAVEQRRVLEEEVADPVLRRQVEVMLAQDESEDGVLDAPAAQRLAELGDASASAPLPEKVGPYRIVDRLGRGGMAVVYRAERADGEFEQTVALKLILPEHTDSAWQERFLQERQLLASLNHPNIAQLLDGGVSDDGSPYFALEYVDGQPITDYCDGQSFSIESRLRLMLSVCDAVSYAHRNLIVHRDLKPSNILVDRDGLPKLLDFGIAKLTTDAGPALTQTGQRALTPEYAAPEQFRGEPVTTATDVYALGVLLYELLLGRRPFVSESQSPVDMERQVLEQRPPSWSQVTGAYDAAERASIAAARQTSWNRLGRRFLGDLEKVVTKALRKEPERRYPSVQALADDLRRFLENLPVQARADSNMYRASKFVSRHRAGVTLGALAAAGLVISTAFALIQAREARLEAQKANETKEFLASLFEYASPDKSLGERLTARQILDLGAIRVNRELAEQPELKAELQYLLADTYVQLGLYEAAEPLAASAAGETNDLDTRLLMARIQRLQGDFEGAGALLDAVDAPTDPAARVNLLLEKGELAREQARYEEAHELLGRALQLDRQRNAPAAELARVLYRLATLRVNEGKNDEALAFLQDARELLENAGARDGTQYATVGHDMGVLLIQSGELEQAREILSGVRDQRLQLLGDSHPDLAGTIKELAGIARLQGQSDQAESLYLRALSIYEAMLGPDHPETANALNSLAVFYRGRGENETALGYAERALESATFNYGAAHPTIGVMTMNVGNMQRAVGQLEQARTSIERALEIILGSVGDSHHLAGVVRNALADVQQAMGDTESAEENFRQALSVFGAASGEQHPHMMNIHAGLARLLLEEGRLDEAETQFRVAISVGEVALPADHPNAAIVWLGLARTLAKAGNCAEAQSIVQTKLQVIEAAGLKDRPDVAAARSDLGECG